MVKTIHVSKIMSDEDIANREGEYFDEKHFDHIVDEDADVYTDDGKLLLKLRKNVIPKKYTDMALSSYRDAAKKTHENRGAAAGELDRNKMNNYIGEFVDQGKFRTKFISNTSGKQSKQATSNLSPSNIIGFYDKPDRNLLGKGPPCRLTAFNRDNPELWEDSVPFIKEIDRLFKQLTPKAHENQLKKCQAVPNFAIADTAYSTVTINYSWRTALHKDKGDFEKGFGNLIVVEDVDNPNTYRGAYTGFPQYGVAANVRTGDFLAMDVHEWHTNTEFYPTNLNINLDNTKRDVKNDWHYNRLSIVCYLRDNMIRCKNLEADRSLPKQKGGKNKKLTKLEILREEILYRFPPELIAILRKNDLFD
tara:strand:- start:155 stop:1243 length:1089 start_codon:yes stop_codon:yes gene_type:complete